MITLHQAVYSAYPNAVFVNGNNANSIVALDVNRSPITIVPSIITNKLSELQAAEAKFEQDATSAKASALAKLATLGLTEAEVKALLG
jgi:hypothetical protein